jgi:IrrE N-terminal-like domain
MKLRPRRCLHQVHRGRVTGSRRIYDVSVIRDALVKRLAADVIVDSGLNGPPVDLYLVAKRAGVTVKRGVELPRGMKACYDDARAEIRVRPGLGWHEERFAIAHELGHHFLEHGGQECRGVQLAGDVVDLDDSSGDVFVEPEASRFGGQLLVPREWCRKDVEAGKTPAEIAARYDVSKEVAFITVDGYRFRVKRSRRR